MGRAPCCDKANVKKGPWSPEEDSKLKDYIERYGIGGNWIALPQKAGLKRCGKSCRLRWLNYLRPNIKHGEFSDEEDSIIFNLFVTIGSRWSVIAAQLPGRTDNDIKNYWNTKLKKKLMGLLPNPNRKPQPLPPLPLPQPCTTTTTTTSLLPLLFPSSFRQQPSPYSSTLTSVATINSVLNSRYEPFSIKDQEFVDFGSDPPRCFNGHENQQMMMMAMNRMIKQDEKVVHHDGFAFDQSIDQWTGEKMRECLGMDQYDLISGRGMSLIDNNHNHNGIDKIGAEEKGLYYY